MLKLFKYNWKLNSMRFYIAITATVLLYALLLIGKNYYGWLDEATFVLSTLVSALSALIIFILLGITFNHSLKSYHRRLIPLTPIEEVLSMILLAIVYSLLGALLSIFHMLVANFHFSNTEVNDALNGLLTFDSIMTILGVVIWNAVSFITLLMLAMSSCYCFRGKYRAWIAVLVYLAVPLAVELIRNWLLGDVASEYYSIIKINLEADAELQGNFHITNYIDLWSMPALIDAVVIMLEIYAIQYIMKKRLQI